MWVNAGLKTALSVLVFTLLAGGIASAQVLDLDGIYRPRGVPEGSWDCKSVGIDSGATEIRGDLLLGLESECKLTKPVQVNGMSAVLYTMECLAEGYETTARVMLMPAEFGVYVISDGFVAEWEYCVAE